MAEQLSIRAVVDRILAAVPGAPFPGTVDTFKSGDPDRPVAGVVTTFLATMEVIERAAALGANLIITHEPTYYTHLDRTEWLAGDPVYAAKAALLDRHGIAVWRFHDHWHAHQPDGIVTGVLRALGWEQYHVRPDAWAASESAQARMQATGLGWGLDPERSFLCEIPAVSLDGLAGQIKQRLGISSLRVAGPADLVCRRVALIVGSPPGQLQMLALGRDDVDVVVAGEINEWETCEYARDSNRMGRPRGLLVIGHAASEEAGMAYLAEWLGDRLPGVSVTHIATGEPLRAR